MRRSVNPRNLRLRYALMISGVLLSMMSAYALAEVDFRARGNEPGWSVAFTGAAIEFRTMEGKSVTVSPIPRSTKSGASEIYAGTAYGKPFSVAITDTICVDSMSGMPHPKSVSVNLGELALAGCGGNPAFLIQGDWIIESLNGVAISGQEQPTVSFDAKGGLSGGGICNRFFGSHELSGEGLTIGSIGSTQMACDQTFMNEESLFLKSLGRVNGFAVNSADVLTLKGQDAVIVLRRK